MKKKLKKRVANLLFGRKKSFFALFNVFSLFLLCSFIPAPVSSTTTTGMTILQDTKITIQQKNVMISKVLDEIEQKTGFSILVRNNDINIRERVSINETDKSLDHILSTLFRGKGVVYEINDKTISIFKPDIKYASVPQQTRTITGTVTDVYGETLIGVNIRVKGNISSGAVTDMDGKYSIANVPANGTLEFSFVGMTTKEIKVSNQLAIDVVLEEDQVGLDEVVVIGYTSQKKALLTGSIVSMNVSEELGAMPTSSAGSILAGKLSGVDIGTPKGVPGAAPSLTIRTESSWNKEYPVFVIDGIVRGEGDFNNLSPNEIENITVLKDAASAAIYGSRSTGGVVLVTTKRGNMGKPVLKYSYSYGIDSRTKNASLTDAVQTGELYNRINPNSDPAGWAWSQEELDHYKTVNNGWGYDQLKTVWKDPSTQTHNLSVNGGSEKVKYFGGVSYVKQQGFLQPLSYDKFNFRLNATVDVTKDLQFFAGMALADTKEGMITWEGEGGLYPKLLRWQPDQPVYTDDGQLVDYGWIANVGGETRGEGGYNRKKFLKPQLVFNLTYKIPGVEGLSAKAAFGTNWAYTRQEEYRTNYDMAILKKEGVNHHIINTDDATIIGYKKSSHNGKEKLEKRVNWGYDYQLNFQLNYNRTFNNVHAIQGALVFEKSESSSGSVYGGRETFPVYRTDQFWAASSARADTWGGGDAEQETGRISYIGQFGYSYANKYLVNFSFREDGSMKFAEDERWGFFPAGSLGWIISEESFFNKNAIDYLKLRGTVGLTGNDNVGGWQWQESYKSGGSNYFGTTPSRSVGITYGGVINPRLTWEKSLSYNIGADMNFLSNWNVSADYWFRKSYDILGGRNASVPTTFSLSMPSENYGQINAQGADLTLGYRNKTNDFNYYGNLTLSYGWNKTIIQDHAENAQWIDIQQGKSTSYKKGYQVDKIIRNQEELDQFNKEHPGYKVGGLSPELGMMVYKDISGPDGKPDGIINSWDRVMLYKNNNPIVYGLNLGGSWKGLNLDVMLNGKLKEKKFFRDLAEGVEWNRMWTEWYDNSWTPENTNAWLPKRISNNSSKSYLEESDFWYQDASFVRLKYVTLSYTLPSKTFGNVLDRVKFFFTGTNLFVLSNFNYYDPERGDGFEYPVMRSFNFGVDVTF